MPMQKKYNRVIDFYLNFKQVHVKYKNADNNNWKTVKHLKLNHLCPHLGISLGTQLHIN